MPPLSDFTLTWIAGAEACLSTFSHLRERSILLEDIMRTTVRTALVVASLALTGIPAVLAHPAGGPVRDAGILGKPVELAQYWGDGRCERLRRACLFKFERGESGEGNCRRYRRECRSAGSYCAYLRRACLYRYELGEVGEGNCRRYRRECGRY
jgi:hypothetical protein